MTFVNQNKDRTDGGLRWGVEPICAVLSHNGARIAPSTYYEAMTHTPSTRELRDRELTPYIERAHADSNRTFGSRRIWQQLNDEGIVVARCTVERLMAQLGLTNARRPAQRTAHPPRHLRGTAPLADDASNYPDLSTPRDDR